MKNLSLKYGGDRPPDQPPRQRTPWTLVVLYAVCVRLSIGYQSYHCGYLYYTVVCIFDYYVLIQYCMSMYIGTNVSVIFAMIIMMNDDVHNIRCTCLYWLVSKWELLLNTSNNDQYSMHMYCTLQVRVQY